MTLRIGMVGTGSFSKMHATILSEMKDVIVPSFCGSSKEKADKMAASFEGAKGYGLLTEMIKTEQLDAVYVCVPPMAHGEIEQQLIDHKIPFLIEKPLAAEEETPLSIINQLKETSLITSVGYHFRYKGSVQKLKESLTDSQIGIVSGQWMGDMPQVHWWRKQEGSGGQFIEQTTHIVDLLRYIAGEIEEVYASYGNLVNHKKFDNVTVADVGTVSLKLKSGVVATLSNTCILPPGMSQVGMSFYTDKSIFTWEPDKLEITQAIGLKQEEWQEDNAYRKETEAFLHAVRTGDTSRILSDYADAYLTHQITCAALESARKGVPIKINS
ncbi:oxidoreductase [Salipaludibacillus neizhouensis]|uniref:Oxidoreductase n=1 Tax=Salipaludibacillus neizhouensis TaxID=885475 RepID=A0A3A9K5E4_9BACI|nr:Gfo/Idh/MocA family oxidoreductase [Salipaludibacillus neizhouensis]RKL65672.1 oxidoreductase [Salipaludibacillus neizhouensis]